MTNSFSSIYSNNLLSDSFQVYRGVKQGSVLSSILFDIVMDEVLKDLSHESTALCIRGLHVGAAAHADDVRTCCIDTESIQAQASVIDSFTTNNSLHLNSSKTELVHMSSHPLPEKITCPLP